MLTRKVGFVDGKKGFYFFPAAFYQSFVTFLPDNAGFLSKRNQLTDRQNRPGSC